MIRQKTLAKIASVALLSIVFSGIPNHADAQYVFKRKINIPVSENSKQFKYPWLGGFNNAQFSNADLNNDGKMDIVVFDREGDMLSTFLNNSTSSQAIYTYAPDYTRGFPKSLRFWMLMDDFDCDGISDIFACTPGQIDYYKGSYDADNYIQFDSVTFFQYRSFNPGLLNIFVTNVDIPAIADVNNDGDMDVVTFKLTGGTEEYYENLSQELTGTCADTILFEKRSECWGDFYETAFTNEVILDSCGGWDRDTCILHLEPQPYHAGTRGARHAGSTSLLYDEDGDGDKELILGDLSFEFINRLINGGNEDCADMILQDHTFPSYDVPYKVSIFPAAFYVDVDNDQKRDLIVCPNSPDISENYRCIWYYKNIGTDTVRFQFQSDTFFVGETLDFGSGAYPVFFDYNGDGLMDILVGNYGYFVNGVDYKSGLALLENVGDSVTPVFKLIDRDYANVSSLMRKGVHPAFGDMDGDGDMDMIIGDHEGFLHYFENTSTTDTAHFVLTTPNYFDIDFNSYTSPFIYDVNGDSLPDLLLGATNGEVWYFENSGTKTNAVFPKNPTNPFFGNIRVRILGFPSGYSTPIISKLDSSKKVYLLSGDNDGEINVYEFNPDSIYSGSFHQLFDRYCDIDVGEASCLTLADLNKDGLLEMVVGNSRGGLTFYSQSDSIAVPIIVPQNDELAGISVFPNPTGDYLNIVFTNPEGLKKLNVELFDVLGRRVLSREFTHLSQPSRITLDVQGLEQGVYFLRASDEQQSSRTIKVMVK